MNLTRKKLRRLIQEQLVKEGILDSIGGFFGFGGGGEYELRIPLGTIKTPFIQRTYGPAFEQGLANLLNKYKQEFISAAAQNRLNLIDYTAVASAGGVALKMNEQQANEFLAANRGLKEEIVSALQSNNPSHGLHRLKLGTSILSILNKMETGRAETEYDTGRTSIGAYATGLDLWNKEISDIAFVNTGGNVEPRNTFHLRRSNHPEIKSLRNSLFLVGIKPTESFANLVLHKNM